MALESVLNRLVECVETVHVERGARTNLKFHPNGAFLAETLQQGAQFLVIDTLTVCITNIAPVCFLFE